MTQSIKYFPGVHFTHEFSIIVSMRWKFPFTLFLISTLRLLQYFVYSTCIAALYMSKKKEFWPGMKWLQKAFPLAFAMWRKNLQWYRAGPWFNIKMSSYRYRKSHCGDKTVVRSSYLHNGISYTGKMTSLYWIRAQCIISYDIRASRRWGFLYFFFG